MVYKAYILQYAPPTSERVNIGMMVSDGETHIQKYIPQDSIDIFDSLFGGNVSSFLKGLWKTSEWTEADWWPDERYFESMGTAMSLIKVHSVEPIVSIEDKRGVSLERFGNRMYVQFCLMPRQGLWGNDPEAIAAKQNFLDEGRKVRGSSLKWPKKARILPGGGLVETITCKGCLVRSKTDGPDDPRTPLCSHPGCFRVSDYGYEGEEGSTELCDECDEMQAVCRACDGLGLYGQSLCDTCKGSGTLIPDEAEVEEILGEYKPPDQICDNPNWRSIIDNDPQPGDGNYWCKVCGYSYTGGRPSKVRTFSDGTKAGHPRKYNPQDPVTARYIRRANGENC